MRTGQNFSALICEEICENYPWNNLCVPLMVFVDFLSACEKVGQIIATGCGRALVFDVHWRIVWKTAQRPLTGVLCHVPPDQGWFRKRIVTLLRIASIAEHLIKSLSLYLEITRGPMSFRNTSACCRQSGSWRTKRDAHGGRASKRKVSWHSLMWITICHKASYIICDLHTYIEKLEHVYHLCTDK